MMDILRLADITAAILAIGSIAGVVIIAARWIQHSRTRAEELERTTLERSRARRAAEKEAAMANSMQESLAMIRARTEQARMREEEAENIFARYIAEKDAKVDEEIDQWLANVQAEAAWDKTLQIAEERLDAQRLEEKRAAVDKAIAEWLAAMEAEGNEARAKEIEQARAETKRAALDRAITEWVDLETEFKKQSIVLPASAERQTLENALEQWATIEQAAAERSEDGQEAGKTAAAESKSAEESLTAWIAAEQIAANQTMTIEPAASQPDASQALSRSPAAQKTYKRSQAIKEQVLATARRIEQEAKDFDYVIHKLDTNAAFMPEYVQTVIEKWKKGEIYRHSTLADLKLKFRYQTHSMFDGWEVLHFYHDWITKQRHKLLIFLRLLGVEQTKPANILAMVEKAEQAELAKHLNMDMDVLFTLKKIREIYQLTASLKSRLQDLEAVCRKYSDQIVAPPWEPRDTL